MVGTGRALSVATGGSLVGVIVAGMVNSVGPRRSVRVSRIALSP